MSTDASRYSLADFMAPDGPDPLVPPDGYLDWRAATRWASSVYEPHLLGPAMPRTRVEFADGATARVLNFASYNYLGLSQHPKCIAAAREALAQYGTGNCGAPMLSGLTDLQAKLERGLNRLLGVESSLVFNGGYCAAIGVLSAVLRKGDIAVADSRIHMSAIDGVRLAQARLATFEHNDPDSLAACLERRRGRRTLVILEGIYSVDGDMARLPELLEVTAQFGAPVYIDEAHSILACGEHGGGVVEHFGARDRVGLRLTTFSKAFAGVGGAVSGTAGTLDYIRCFANSYTFSATLPPATLAALIAAMEVANEECGLRERLWENARYFRRQLNGLGVDTGNSESYIVPLVVGSSRETLYETCHAMRRRGLFLPPVDYPVVPEDQLRFRASVTAAHTRQDLDEALNIIEDTFVRAVRKGAECCSKA